MCVIAHCVSARPTLAELEKMEKANTAGGGIAWFAKGRVNWEKGISAKRIDEILNKVSLPAVIHFRLATVGGQTRKLCHPFPISEQAELFKAGTASAVLFHNGHCNDWELYSMVAGVKLKGDVSDTRALAAITFKNQNYKWLDKITGKFVVMDADPETTLRFGWFSEQKGIWYSNLIWDSYRSNTGYAGPGKYRGGLYGGDDDFRGSDYWKEFEQADAKPAVYSTCYTAVGGEIGDTRCIGTVWYEKHSDGVWRNWHSGSGKEVTVSSGQPNKKEVASSDSKKMIGFGNNPAIPLAEKNGSAATAGTGPCTGKTDCLCPSCIDLAAQELEVEKRKLGGKGYTHALNCECARCRFRAQNLAKLRLAAQPIKGSLDHSKLCTCRECWEIRTAVAWSIAWNGDKPGCKCPKCMNSRISFYREQSQQMIALRADVQRMRLGLLRHDAQCNCDVCLQSAREEKKAAVTVVQPTQTEQEQALQEQADLHLQAQQDKAAADKGPDSRLWTTDVAANGEVTPSGQTLTQ